MVDARRMRAIAFMALAIIAAAVAAVPYLRPAPARILAVPTVTQLPGGSVQYQFTVTGRTDGGFFVWTRPGWGSGGHAR